MIFEAGASIYVARTSPFGGGWDIGAEFELFEARASIYA